MCETRKFVMAILHWKQGLLCDKNNDQIANSLAACVDFRSKRVERCKLLIVSDQHLRKWDTSGHVHVQIFLGF